MLTILNVRNVAFSNDLFDMCGLLEGDIKYVGIKPKKLLGKITRNTQSLTPAQYKHTKSISRKIFFGESMSIYKVRNRNRVLLTDLREY